MESGDLENQLALLRDTYFTQLTEFNNRLNVEDARQVELPDSLSSPDIPFEREAILDSVRNGNHQVLQLEMASSA